jgi:hypothetical protein
MADGLCYTDMDEYGTELDDPVAELEQDIVHLLIETWGTNPDALTRSVGLEDQLSGPSSTSLKSYIESKLLLDDRVQAVSCAISRQGTSSNRIDLKIEINEQTIGIALQFDGAGNVVRAT